MEEEEKIGDTRPKAYQMSQINEKSPSKEIKINYMIHKILSIRKNSIFTIINFLKWRKGLKNRIKFLKKYLIYRIIEERNVSIRKIQTTCKYYYARKLVKEIKKKEKENFTIITGIKHSKELYIKVDLNNGLQKIFYFEFCKLRSRWVLYIPRGVVSGCVFRVNFIADGKIVIDPMFKADYNSNGEFFNIIDFNLIEKQERITKEDRERVLKFHRDRLNQYQEFEAYLRNSKESEGINFSSSSDTDEDSYIVKRSSPKRNSTQVRSRQATNSASQLHKLGKTRTQLNLNFCFSPLKSILKTPNCSKTKLIKRVSFCENINPIVQDKPSN